MNAEDILVTPMDMADTLMALAALYRVKLAKEMPLKAFRHSSWPSFARPDSPGGPHGLSHGRGRHPGEAHGHGGHLDGLGGLVQSQVGQGDAPESLPALFLVKFCPS